MAEIVGGKRLRIIKDSFHNMLKTALDDLGWFAPESGLRTKPFNFIPEQITNEDEIKANTVGVSSENLYSYEAETGSDFVLKEWNFYVDILAEDEAVGIHLSGDIADIIEGRFSALSGIGPRLAVYGLNPSTEILFYCDMDEVEVNRVRDWDRALHKYWWVVACKVSDMYYDDSV